MSHLARPIEALFAAPVRAAQCRCSDASALDELYPGEAATVARAVEKRRLEFAAGRRAARRALAGLGVASVELPADPRTRAPVWPSGIIGSITHTEDWCAAVVVQPGPITGIGLDAEPDAPLEAELSSTILRPEEQAAPDASGPALGSLLRRTFVAKEAFYKAQFPSSQAFLEFTDVEILWDGSAHADQAAFRVRCSHPEAAALARRARGRLHGLSGLLVAGCEILSETSGLR